MFTLAGDQGQCQCVLSKAIWHNLSEKKERRWGERGQEVMDWSTKRAHNCHAEPGWDWKLYADIRGGTPDIAKSQNAKSVIYIPSTVCIIVYPLRIFSWCLIWTGHASGLPGDVHSVWLCGAFLLCVSPGGHVCSYQQHNRDPQWCPETLYWPSEAFRTESGEHWTMAGQGILFWKMSDKASML